MATPSLLVFGPQTTIPSREYLIQLRTLLLQDERLQPLRSAVEGLPSLWQRLVDADSELTNVPGQSCLENFPRWLAGGDLFPSDSITERSNVLITPLTVLLHIAQYLIYLDTKKESFTHRDVLSNAATRGGVQGFCTGLLSAATIASAESEGAFLQRAATALRLAVAVGAYVDRDGLFHDPPREMGCLVVKWNQDGGREKLADCLKQYPEAYISAVTEQNAATVTAHKTGLKTLLNVLSLQGLTAKRIGLEGRFHSDTHEAAAARLIAICRSNPELQLPLASHLLAPVRSNVDAGFFTTGALHDLIINSILVDLCNWHTTISTATSQLVNYDHTSILQVGFVDCIPTTTVRDSSSCVVRLRNAEPLMSSVTESACPPISRTATPSPISSQYGGWSSNSIAVVGMSCKFPGANSISEFWDLVAEGKSMVRQMPEERFGTTGLRRSPDDKLKFWGNFVDDIEAFDHRFFKKSAREASSMDPQQRLLLQVAYEAMESSGYFGELSKSPPNDIGCYIGVCASDYNDNVASHLPNAYSSLGTLRAFLSGKLSHFFGWTGPSITYDTACSSSAVAIHAACKAIQTGECSRAVAGGVSLFTSPNFYQNLAAASFLSPTGPTKPFDASGDGYCRGEGIGLVVLKSLSSAVADGDHIMGVIASTAVNQNENSTAITVPHSGSQIKLYEKVVSDAGVKAHDISFVEAHGTGTPVGDPIEFESIRQVFGGATRASPLHVASVKGNIGHLEGASGVAALIKTVLMMENGVIPIQANHHRLNPKIAPLHPDKLEIPLSTHSWDVKYQVACINNYGAAGSNAAMIVCQAPKIADGLSSGKRLPKYPFYVSANSQDSLYAYCRALENVIEKLRGSYSEEQLLASLTYNLSCKQNRSLPQVLSGSASTLAELQEQLSSKTRSKTLQLPKPRPVVLVFGGQVSTFVGLDRDLFLSSDILRSNLEHVDHVLSSIGLKSIFPKIFETEPVEDIVQLHSMLFAVQYSCAKTWIDSGLRVDAIIGHSFGQLTGLGISGVLSLEDCIRLVTTRASLMQTSWGPEKGSMISVQADISTVTRLISANKALPKPEIACYNATDSHVIVGTSAAIDEVEEHLQSPSGSFASVKYKRLNVTHGFHSRFTEDILPELTKAAQRLTFSKPKITFETCSDISAWETINAERIKEHTRRPVYFAQAVTRLASRFGPCTWVEAGSNSSITGMVRRALGTSSASSHYFQPVQLGISDAMCALVDATCNLWKEGHKVQFWPFHYRQRSDYQPLTLPPYQFEKTRHWLDWQDTVAQIPVVDSTPPPAEIKDPVFLSLVKYLDGQRLGAEFAIDTRSEEYKFFVNGHAVLAQPLCPAPLYIELASQSALALASNSKDQQPTPIVERLEIQAPLGANETVISLMLKRSDKETNSWKFTFATQEPGSAAQIHATGTVRLVYDIQDINAELSRFERLVGHRKVTEIMSNPYAEALQGAMVYKVFGKVVTYADYYKGVKSVFAKDREVAGNVALPKSETKPPANTVTNPLAVDNFIQVSGLHVNCLTEIAENEVFVCTKVDRIQPSPDFINDPNQYSAWTIYSNYHPTGEKEIVNDIFVFDMSSQKLLFVVLGARFTRVMISSLTRVLSRANTNLAVSFSEPKKEVTSPVAPSAKPVPTSRSPSEVRRQPETAPSSPDTSLKFKRLLNSVTEVPMDDLRDHATLEDLGVDSLMVTEVLAEINKAFAVSITMDEFALMTDIASVVKALNRMVGVSESEASDDSGDYSDDSASLTYQPTGTITPVSMPGTPSAMDGLVHQLGTLVAGHLETAEVMTRDTNLAEQGLDSLLCMELASDIKKMFDADVDMAQLTMDSTFGDLIDIVAAKVDLCPSVSLPTSVKPAALRSPEFEKFAPTIDEGRGPLASAQTAFEAIRFDYDIYTKQTGFHNFWKQVYPTQARLVLAYTVEAFTKLGCDLASLKPGEPIPSIQYQPKHQQLVNQLHSILRDAQLIATDGSLLVRSDQPVDPTPSGIILKQLHAEAPQHISEHKLLDITGSKLAECMAGTADPLALLFRDKDNKALLEDVYTNGPMYEAISKLLVSFFGKALTGAPKSDTINILELGGGTGGTTKHIVDFLVRHEVPFTYTFTDISGSLVAAARKKFVGIAGMQFQVIDIEKEPADKLKGKYHAVISTNCIHATRNLELSTRHIRQMLCPGGFIALVEFTRNMYWFDLVFGLLEGWWLFNDGRPHVLADEWFWDSSMRDAGFEHVTWTDGSSEEARTLRIICGFNAKPQDSSMIPRRRSSKTEASVETVLYKQVGSTALFADIYYPPEITSDPRPIALMIHGGGHVMLSRKDIRPKQTSHLHALGFLPVSIDYRLCPEVTLPAGPMTDAVDALDWVRRTLPRLPLLNPGLRLDTSRVAVVGWSTGGHVAMTTAYTSVERGLTPPSAILAFYCPTDYEDPCWREPNYPESSNALAQAQDPSYDPCESIQRQPITAYNVPTNAGAAVGGWCAPSDARSRLVFHMNWRGQCLPVLLNGLPPAGEANPVAASERANQPQPDIQRIRAVSPYAQILNGKYRVPTCIVHGDEDDLIPWEQSLRVGEALKERGVNAQVQIERGKKHLFDLFRDADGSSWAATERAYGFLAEEVFGNAKH